MQRLVAVLKVLPRERYLAFLSLIQERNGNCIISEDGNVQVVNPALAPLGSRMLGQMAGLSVLNNTDRQAVKACSEAAIIGFAADDISKTYPFFNLEVVELFKFQLQLLGAAPTNLPPDLPPLDRTLLPDEAALLKVLGSSELTQMVLMAMVGYGPTLAPDLLERVNAENRRPLTNTSFRHQMTVLTASDGFLLGQGQTHRRGYEMNTQRLGQAITLLWQLVVRYSAA